MGVFLIVFSVIIFYFPAMNGWFLEAANFWGTYMDLYAKVGIAKDGVNGISEWILGGDQGNYWDDGTAPTSHWEKVKRINEGSAGEYIDNWAKCLSAPLA